MKPEYFAITFDTTGYDNEIWAALLSQWPFESFHEEDHKIIGYILRHDITEEMLRFVDEYKGTWYHDYHLEQVPDKNWNTVWESSFNPVSVDDYCYIRAAFHTTPAGGYKHEIVIAPKMAFGTGHHATTFMMVKAMSNIDFKGKKVFDFGSGTGILAIVAAKEGAAKVVGVDIQPEALDNSIEHAGMNDVSGVCRFYMGGINSAPFETYDVIFANINRNVIRENFPELIKRLHPGGQLLISGILTQDLPDVTELLDKYHFQITAQREKDNWIQLTAQH